MLYLAALYRLLCLYGCYLPDIHGMIISMFVYIVFPDNYAHDSRFVVLSCGKNVNEFTYILQNYFIDTGQSLTNPGARETIPKYIGKIRLVNPQETWYKQKRNKSIGIFSWDTLLLWSQLRSGTAGLLFTENTPSYGYRNPHYEPKDDRLRFMIGIPIPIRRCLERWIEAMMRGCRTYRHDEQAWWLQMPRCQTDKIPLITSWGIVASGPFHRRIVSSLHSCFLRVELWSVHVTNLPKQPCKICDLIVDHFTQNCHIYIFQDLNYFWNDSVVLCCVVGRITCFAAQLMKWLCSKEVGNWMNEFKTTLPGIVSISHQSSYRKTPWNLEVARLVVEIITWLWNLTDASRAVLSMCLSHCRTIG